jgi:hypothetical protein
MNEQQAGSDFHRTSDKGNSFWISVSNEQLENEITSQWAIREFYRNFIDLQEAEVLKIDAILGELFFELKQKLSQPGRNGAWSAFLKQHNIMKNTADRLALDYTELHGLADELPHRFALEPPDSELVPGVHLSASIRTATEAWYEARHRFQHEAGKEQRDAYDAATNKLGQSLSEWQTANPELAEQIRFWFLAHGKD